MKKLLSILSVLLCAYFSKAQQNNPYNQVGLDYVKSLSIIKKDFEAGKIKDFSQEAIDEYSKQLPSKVQVDIDLVTKVFSTLKSKDFDYIKYIKGSKFSELSKDIFINAVTNSHQLKEKELEEYYTLKVDEIIKSNLEDSEKEAVLSFVSIAYNLTSSGYEQARESSCYVVDEYGATHPASCILVGGVIGFGVGFPICGLWCGIGGAVVGGIIGSFC